MKLLKREGYIGMGSLRRIVLKNVLGHKDTEVRKAALDWWEIDTDSLSMNVTCSTEEFFQIPIPNRGGGKNSSRSCPKQRPCHRWAQCFDYH
jgi:hypothetical protein